MLNVMQGAVAAVLMKSANQSPDRVVAIAALSALTPGVLGLALPLVAAKSGTPSTVPGTTPAAVPVPGVIGKSIVTAINLLEEEGFLVTAEESDKVSGGDFLGPGSVVDQRPIKNDLVSKGSTVHLTVLSLGLDDLSSSGE